MKTKHGIKLSPWPVQSLADEALHHGYTHIWAFYPVEKLGIPANGDGYTYQENVRHGKTATVSVWKRGVGHVNIIYLNNTAWVEGAEAFKDVTPAQLLDAVNEIERTLGITIAGSPGGAGWSLLKKLHPEWIENIPVNLRDLHFTSEAGPDLIWQYPNYSAPKQKYIHKFDKNSAYPAASAMTDIGVGTPIHLIGDDAIESAMHTKGHPQEVGVWFCRVERPESFNRMMNMPIKVFGPGDYWLSGPRIRMLVDAGFKIHVIEGYVFPERHDLLVKWANVLWEGRQQTTNPIVAKAYKQIANATIGFTAFKGFDEDEDEKRRPDIRLQVVSRNAEIMWHNIQKINDLYHMKPYMVYMDAVYYLSDESVLTFDYFKQRESKLGGFKYEGSIEITPDVQVMFAEKMNVVKRLEFLNKIGWVK